MPRKNYRELHQKVLERTGASERLDGRREQILAEIGLFELRRRLTVSQVDLASRLEVTQPAISKIEHADDLRLSTLREYVEALGGRLEIRAVFDDEAVPLALP